MLKVGLTGGIGSGKTTVSDLFKTLGISVIDTDIIARDLLNKNHEVSQEVINIFGKNIVDENNVLDRKKLAACVFNNASNKQKLENILHPKIRNEVNQKIRQYISEKKPPDYIIIVVPLLFETNFNDIVDRTLVVMADKEKRINRVKSRDNRSTDEINSIIAHQIDDATRRNHADEIIINNGDISDLRPQINDLHTKYLRLAKTYR